MTALSLFLLTLTNCRDCRSNATEPPPSSEHATSTVISPLPPLAPVVEPPEVAALDTSSWPPLSFGPTATYEGANNVIEHPPATDVVVARASDETLMLFERANPSAVATYPIAAKALVSDGASPLKTLAITVDRNHVAAFELRSGRQRWSTELALDGDGGLAPIASIAEAPMGVLVHMRASLVDGGFGDELVLLSPGDGRVVFRSETSSPRWRVHGFGGDRIVLSDARSIGARDARDGRWLWRIPRDPDPVIFEAETLGTIVLVHESDRLRALNVNDGHEVWLRPIPRGRVEGGRRYILVTARVDDLQSTELIVLDRETGRELFRQVRKGDHQSGTKLDDERGVLYGLEGHVTSATRERPIVAYDVTSGRKIWRSALPILARSYESIGYFFDEDAVFVCDEAKVVHALSRATGREVGSWGTGSCAIRLDRASPTSPADLLIVSGYAECKGPGKVVVQRFTRGRTPPPLVQNTFVGTIMRTSAEFRRPVRHEPVQGTFFIAGKWVQSNAAGRYSVTVEGRGVALLDPSELGIVTSSRQVLFDPECPVHHFDFIEPVEF